MSNGKLSKENYSIHHHKIFPDKDKTSKKNLKSGYLFHCSECNDWKYFLQNKTNFKSKKI